MRSALRAAVRGDLQCANRTRGVIPLRRSLPVAVQRRGLSSTKVARGPGKLIVGGVAVVAGVGGYAYYKRLRKNDAVNPELLNERQQEIFASLTKDELQRTGVTLYRYLTCPFCGKVQAFLERFNIPYETVEVDPLTKAQLGDVGGYSKVPVVRLGKDGNGAILVDSFDIVSALAPKFSGQADSDEVMRWRKWAGEEFVRYLTLNLNRSLTDAYNSTCYIDVADNIPWANRLASKVLGSITMYLVVQVFATRPKLKKMGYDGGDERKALYGQLSKWVNEGLAGKPFHGGEVPDSADTDVYGVLHAIRGLPAYMDALRNSDPLAKEWVARMDLCLGRQPVDLAA